MPPTPTLLTGPDVSGCYKADRLGHKARDILTVWHGEVTVSSLHRGNTFCPPCLCGIMAAVILPWNSDSVESSAASIVTTKTCRSDGTKSFGFIKVNCVTCRFYEAHVSTLKRFCGMPLSASLK